MKSVRYLQLLFASILLLFLFMIVSCTKEEPTVTLRIWQTETDKDAVKELDTIITKFKNYMLSQEKQKVEIMVETIPWNALAQKLAVALQTGNEPDICHLEPFMAYSLVKRELLLPLDDLINEIQTVNNDTIFQVVKDLQKYKEKTYGIAYALGVTGFAYRKDWADKIGLKEPKTWSDFIEFTKKLINSRKNKQKILLPGGDPFFIDQLFAELLVNNGGKLFNPQSKMPLLTSREVVEVLEFFKELKPFIYDNWLTLKYLEQFNLLGKGDAAIVPVTYVRAVKSIENQVASIKQNSVLANPDYFALMQQPIGISNKEKISYSTIDCEPFVIFKRSLSIQTGKNNNAYYSKEFLKYFYMKENYLKFVTKVPIHLTPIFQDMAKTPEYLSTPLIDNWMQWQNFTTNHIKENRVRPILMPDLSENGRMLPFLLEFQAKNILTSAVIDVLVNDLSPEEAAKKAQYTTINLLKSLGY